MISRYRTKGLIQLACAFVISALFVYLAFWRNRWSSSDDYFILLLFLYMGCWSMWMIASYNLAKAKGYGDTVGGIFLFLIVLGFFLPVAAIAFPAVVLFGLKDKTTRRRH